MSRALAFVYWRKVRLATSYLVAISFGEIYMVSSVRRDVLCTHSTYAWCCCFISSMWKANKLRWPITGVVLCDKNIWSTQTIRYIVSLIFWLGSFRPSKFSVKIKNNDGQVGKVSMGRAAELTVWYHSHAFSTNFVAPHPRKCNCRVSMKAITGLID